MIGFGGFSPPPSPSPELRSCSNGLILQTWLKYLPMFMVIKIEKKVPSLKINRKTMQINIVWKTRRKN